MTLSPPAVGVLLVVEVTLRAVRLHDVSGRHRLSAKQVFALGHWLEMSRVHAPAIPAEVIDRQALGDRPDD
jgi:hypothetical protein